MDTLSERVEQINDEAAGTACDDLEFRVCSIDCTKADITFADGGAWVTRVPGTHVTLEVLDAIATAVRCGRALGRAEGKREIGAYLRDECGL